MPDVDLTVGCPQYHMVLPPSAQVEPPFAANVGGIDPAFFSISAVAARGLFDSWLTIGITEGDGGAFQRPPTRRTQH